MGFPGLLLRGDEWLTRAALPPPRAPRADGCAGRSVAVAAQGCQGPRGSVWNHRPYKPPRGPNDVAVPVWAPLTQLTQLTPTLARAAGAPWVLHDGGGMELVAAPERPLNVTHQPGREIQDASKRHLWSITIHLLAVQWDCRSCSIPRGQRGADSK
jgi:hypothetical protein